MRILITGVAGFLGHRFAEWIVRHQPDCTIIGIDDLSGGFRDNVPPQVQFHRMRLGSSGSALRGLFHKGIDIVYHFAAYAAEGLSPFVRQYNYINNLVATAELLNAALEVGGVQRFVFTSSMAVYGRADVPFAEEMSLSPIDPYGVAKMACERDIQIAGEQHGLDWCIIRPHNVYGPGQNLWDPYRNVLGIWMQRHLQDEPLLIYGDGRQRRAFSWIDDCLPPLWEAGVNQAASCQIINLGGRKPIAIKELMHVFTEAVGTSIFRYAEARHEVRDAWATTDTSERLLGYRETCSLSEGLGRMWAWANTQPPRRYRPPMIELKRGLYSYWASENERGKPENRECHCGIGK